MIAKDGFNLSSFNSTNKAYIAVTDEINEYNDTNQLKDEAVLTIDGYISYLKGENAAETAKYLAFDNALAEKDSPLIQSFRLPTGNLGLIFRLTIEARH